MSYIYNKDQVKLKALEYAEKNKIVNQKSINAFIAGFNFRDSHNSIPTLNYLSNVFKNNFNSWEDDCGYGDYRGEMFNRRREQGLEALSISKEIDILKNRIETFNKKYKTEY